MMTKTRDEVRKKVSKDDGSSSDGSDERTETTEATVRLHMQHNRFSHNLQVWKDERQRFLKQRFPKEPRSCDHSSALSKDFQTDLNCVGSLMESRCLEDQNKMAVECVIGLLTGIVTRTIHCTVDSNGDYRWMVDPGFDPGLRGLIFKCFPFVEAHDRSVLFFERIKKDHRRGLVAGALASTMDVLDGKMLESMAVLDKKSKCKLGLDVAQLLTSCVDWSDAWLLLADIAHDVDKDDLVGGEILTLVDRKRQECVNPRLRRILDRVMGDCMRPYLKALDVWIFFGRILDIGGDFMIRDLDTWRSLGDETILQRLAENDFDTALDNFDRRHELVEDLCPSFLLPVAADVLKCGKYLHIIEKCEKSKIASRSGKKRSLDWELSEGTEKLVESVEAARLEASQALWTDILLSRYHLLQLFQSVRRFVLVGNCDWLSLFMHVAYELLDKEIDGIDETALNTLFDVAVQHSSLKHDGFKDMFRVILERSSLTAYLNYIANIKEAPDFLVYDQARLDKGLQAEPGLNGFEAVSLHLQVSDPLSIVFNPKVLLQYQIIFRRLFSLHRVIKLLTSQWQKKRVSADKAENCLRDSMLNFANSYLSYCCIEVLEPRWLHFENQLKTVTNVEEVLWAQSSFLDEANKACMLTDADLIRIMGQILNLLADFANNRVTPYGKVATKFNGLKSVLVEKMRLLGADPANRNTGWIHFAQKILPSL